MFESALVRAKVVKYQKLITAHDILLWLTVGLSLVLVLNSYPMMKLRYDIWDHVYRIRDMVLDPLAPSPAKRYWYACWAFVFKIFGVTDIFTMAIVIHRIQFIANCIMVYFVAKQIYAPLLSLNVKDQKQGQWLSSLALSSVLIWLVTIGTYSHMQNAWIMWYSVNYQITLTFLLLSIALVLNVLTAEQSINIIIIKTIVSSVLLVLILMFHAGELAYFIFYAPILLICFAAKLKMSWKQALVLCCLIVLAGYAGLQFYADQTPRLISLLKSGEVDKIGLLIREKGTWNALEGGNRYAGNWNEMYRLSVYAMFVLAVSACFGLFKFHKKILAFLVLSLVFCFAPTYVFSSGFLSLVSYDGIVNRYYFASFLFLSIPCLVYVFLNKLKHRILAQPIVVFYLTLIFVVAVFTYSKYINQQGVFYQNVKSITTSMRAKRLDVEVSDSDLFKIKQQLLDVENTHKINDFMYCGSYEKIYMVMYYFNRKNTYFDRADTISITQCEENAKKLNKYVIYVQ